MRKKIIPNMPMLPYDGNNVDFFIVLIEATLKVLGEECDKAKLVAISGEGNRFCWTDGAWVFGNELTESINESPFETERRVLSAIGWKANYITVHHGKSGSCEKEELMKIRRDFVSAIDKGFPVIMRYAEYADCDLNLFFGYEDSGQKIIGYNYNNGFKAGVSLPQDADAPISWENWESNIAGYILLQEKSTRAVTERDTALSAFRFISEHARKTDVIGGRKVGLAAWESFLWQLEYDDFSKIPFEEVKNRFYIYCDALCQINARKTVLPYYHHLTELFPECKDHLDTAIQALDDCASYGGYLWERGFTFDEAGIERFRSPQERKILADAGRKAMYKDMLAVEQLETIISLENYSYSKESTK